MGIVSPASATIQDFLLNQDDSLSGLCPISSNYQKGTAMPSNAPPSLTDEQLQRIERRAIQATPGPWEWQDCNDGGGGVTNLEGLIANGCIYFPARREQLYWMDRPGSAGEQPIIQVDPAYIPMRVADAHFIAHARDDIPALITEIRRLRSLLNFKITVQVE